MDKICFNSLPNNKIFGMTKLKVFADDKVNVPQMMISLCNRVKNSVGKRENVFVKALFIRVVKSRDCMVKSYGITWWNKKFGV